jgi:hypothetical protein
VSFVRFRAPLHLGHTSLLVLKGAIWLKELLLRSIDRQPINSFCARIYWLKSTFDSNFERLTPKRSFTLRARLRLAMEKPLSGARYAGTSYMHDQHSLPGGHAVIAATAASVFTSLLKGA